METGNILYELRMKNGLSQDELAQKLFVTRQAVSRWENGETVPNTEALKLLSRTRCSAPSRSLFANAAACRLRIR